MESATNRSGDRDLDLFLKHPIAHSVQVRYPKSPANTGSRTNLAVCRQIFREYQTAGAFSRKIPKLGSQTGLRSSTLEFHSQEEPIMLNKLTLALIICVTTLSSVATTCVHAQLLRRPCFPFRGKSDAIRQIEFSDCCSSPDGPFFQRNFACPCIVTTRTTCSGKCTLEYINGQWYVTKMCENPAVCYCQIPIDSGGSNIIDDTKRAACEAITDIPDYAFKLDLDTLDTGMKCVYVYLGKTPPTEDTPMPTINVRKATDPRVITWKVDVTFKKEAATTASNTEHTAPTDPVPFEGSRIYYHNSTTPLDAVHYFIRGNNINVAIYTFEHYEVTVTKTFN